ncbi:hypothetical protein [Peribacillus acanthi]|uniref:hypothetical protein n=1 Tax=Peribacillus acanthi TaxID=2171554 RepID=UPI000D3ECCFA|nr:hypothetical protein [Peribacillus acanthi]
MGLSKPSGGGIPKYLPKSKVGTVNTIASTPTIILDVVGKGALDQVIFRLAGHTSEQRINIIIDGVSVYHSRTILNQPVIGLVDETFVKSTYSASTWTSGVPSFLGTDYRQQNIKKVDLPMIAAVNMSADVYSIPCPLIFNQSLRIEYTNLWVGADQAIDTAIVYRLEV